MNSNVGIHRFAHLGRLFTSVLGLSQSADAVGSEEKRRHLVVRPSLLVGHTVGGILLPWILMLTPTRGLDVKADVCR